MSITYLVRNGKIPAVALKEFIMKKGIPGVTFIPSKGKGEIELKYGKSGVWIGSIKNGNVVNFTEYAGGHGVFNEMYEMLTRLEKKFKCEIADYDTFVEMDEVGVPPHGKLLVPPLKKSIINHKKTHIPSVGSKVDIKVSDITSGLYKRK